MSILATSPINAVKKTLRGALFSSVCLLSACDPISGGSLLLDCIDDDGPVLNPRTLPTPVLNYSYEAVITASIENEPYDDRFEYTFTLGAGLPEGLIVDTFQRQVRITGAPTELGDFAMRVEVGVADPTSADRDRRLCRRSTAINYVFSVAETLDDEQETQE
jgi:hypothetical protein